MSERESMKAKLEAQARLRGRRGVLARKRLTEARTQGCHHVPGVEPAPRTPLRPSGRADNLDSISRGLGAFDYPD